MNEQQELLDCLECRIELLEDEKELLEIMNDSAEAEVKELEEQQEELERDMDEMIYQLYDEIIKWIDDKHPKLRIEFDNCFIKCIKDNFPYMINGTLAERIARYYLQLKSPFKI